MNDYSVEKMRNVVLLGSSGCGKTTVVEAMAFASAVTNRLGNVQDGNTISDFDKEEINRKFSVNTSVIQMEWEGCTINVIDTPGNLDFSGERECAVSAADGAVILVNGKRGVESGTIKSWELCEKYHLPRVVFVTAMDDDNASYREVIENLTELFGKKIAPFHQPIRKDGKFVGYVNITKMNARRFTGIAQYEEIEIPDYSHENLGKFREILLDAVASTSDELMEKYFNGEEFTQDEINDALRLNCWDGTIVPVTMGSGLNVHGVFMLMNDIARFLPPPNRGMAGINKRNDDIFDGQYDANAAFAAQVFKTISDPFIGKYSLVKLYSGRIKAGSVIYNERLDKEEKVTRLYVLRGKEMVETAELYAGQIGAIPKLMDTVTGDTLSTKSIPVAFDRVKYPVPYTYMKYRIANKNDETKAAAALAKMMEEDITIKTVNDKENGQMLIYGIGEQQLEIVASKLLNKYKVELILERPEVAYRETISKSADAEGKYKKQSGGHGQYGHVVMRFEPLYDREIPFEFEDKVVGGSVPRKFIPAVEKGVEDSLKSGPLAAYPVVGIKAILLDGSAHSVDSSEMSFKTAAVLCFKNAFVKAEPKLLEPIMSLKIHAPEKYTGDIISDLQTRRAKILGTYSDDLDTPAISAEIPSEELFGFNSVLRSMTEGFGEFEYEFLKYSDAPDQIQKKQIAKRADLVNNKE